MTFLNWSRQCLLYVCLLIFVKESTYSPPGVNTKAKIKTKTNKNPNLFQPQAVKTQMSNLLKCMHICKTPLNPVQIYSSIQKRYVNTERSPSRVGNSLSSVWPCSDPKITSPQLSFHHVSECYTPSLSISARPDEDLESNVYFNQVFT